MAQKKLKIGIIGLGVISDAHVEGAASVSDIAEITAVCDVDRAKAAAVADRFGATVFTDYHELLDVSDLDVIDIILPHHLHYEVGLVALERGKHVLMEKPLTVVPEEGLALIHKAREKGVIFSVAENTRFVKAYMEAEKLLRDGTIGEVYQIRTLIAGSEIDRLRNPHPWKATRNGSGGGVIMDAGPHTFYLLKWLFGDIAELQAFHTQVIDVSEVEDNALIRGRMTSGAEFSLQFSFTAMAPWTERLEIYGSKRALMIDQICDPPVRLFAGTEDFHGRPITSVPYDPVNWKYTSIFEEVRDFITVVRNEGTPKVDPLDAYYGLVVIQKAYESAVSGKPLAIPKISQTSVST